MPDREPFELPHDPIDRVVTWSMKRQKVLVTMGPRANGGLVFRALVLAVVGVAAVILASSDYLPAWLRLVGELVACIMVAVAATRGLGVTLAYRSGWLDGRAELNSRLQEAETLGQSWRFAKRGGMAHDLAILFGQPKVPKDASGLDDA